ncbi:MAG TPA: hypothetical protein VD994_14875 [Prosthecobacter sp.]|nr:hypothetical protein [Prosthecobacter sp.]
MSDPDAPQRGVVFLMAGLALAALALFALFILASREPDPLHSARRSDVWSEPIQ